MGAEQDPWNLDYVLPVAREAGIEIDAGDYAARLVVHAACMLNVILEEQELGPIVRMEDVVSDPGALVSLVSFLTAGTIVTDRGWSRGRRWRGRSSGRTRAVTT